MVKEYPAIIGEDGGGVVQRVGNGITSLLQGNKVFFQTSFGNKYGTYQGYCLTSATLAIKIPPNVSFKQAASIGTGLHVDKPIVIMGSGASLGKYVNQLAQLSGFSPIITTASLHNQELLISLGATHVLDQQLSTDTLREQCTKITNAPITYIFDAVSFKETQQTAFSLLSPGGTLAVVTQPQVKGREGNRSVTIVIGSFHFAQNRELGAKFSTALTKWLAEGAIKPNKVEVLPGGLKAVVSGLRRLKMNGVSATKLVVRPAETPDY